MSKALEIVVVHRGLPAEGKRKTTIGKMPGKTVREEVDKAFTAAEAGLDRLSFTGEWGMTDEEWDMLRADLNAIHKNSANTSDVQSKAGYLYREMWRKKQRYNVQYTATAKTTGKSGRAKARAKKAAKAAASRALRAQMKSPKRG